MFLMSMIDVLLYISLKTRTSQILVNPVKYRNFFSKIDPNYGLLYWQTDH